MQNIAGTDIWKLTITTGPYENIIFNNGGGGTQTSNLVYPTDSKVMYDNRTSEWTEFSGGAAYSPEDTSGRNIITLNAGAGTGYMSVLLNESGTYTLLQCAFIRPENRSTFKAWSIGGTEYQPGDTITVSDDTVISALWNILPLKITPIGNYTDKITIEKETADDKAVFTITPIDGSTYEISSVTLFVAEYNDNGQLSSIKLGENQIVDGKLVITADLPESNNYKFMLWDNANCPLINSITNID